MNKLIKRSIVSVLLFCLIMQGFNVTNVNAINSKNTRIVVDYATSIGRSNGMMFGGVNTPLNSDSEGWTIVSGQMGIKVVKINVDLARLFVEDENTMDTDELEGYTHVAAGQLTKLKSNGIQAMLAFENIPSWLDTNGDNMPDDLSKYTIMVEKFLRAVKIDYEEVVGFVEVKPAITLEKEAFVRFYKKSAETARNILPEAKIGGPAYQISSKEDRLPKNVVHLLEAYSTLLKDRKLLEFVSFTAYEVEPTNASDDMEVFGEFKEARKVIRKATENADLPLYMTGWTTAGKEDNNAGYEITGKKGIKYHTSALFKAMRDGWPLVMFNSLESKEKNPASYIYEGNESVPFVKTYNLLSNQLALGKEQFKVVSADMGNNWIVDDSIAMINSDNQPVLFLMNFGWKKTGVTVRMENLPLEDGSVTLETHVATSNSNPEDIFSSIEATVQNGVLDMTIPVVPRDSAMGVIIKDGKYKTLPTQVLYEFESQENHFGGDTEIQWATSASFNRVVKNFGGRSNFVTIRNIQANGTGSYTVKLYAQTENSDVKVITNEATPISVDASSVSLGQPVEFIVNLNAGNKNKMTFYTESGELKPDKIVLVPNDITLSLGIRNMDQLELENGKYLLPLAEGAFKLEAEIFPEELASEHTILFQSSNASVVTVSDEGLLVPRSVGEAEISVAIEGTDISQVFTIKVENLMTSLKVSPENINLIQGEEAKILATVLPETVSNKEITWSTSDVDKVQIIAEDNSQVTIKAVAEQGEATIKAIAENGRFVAQTKVKILSAIQGGKVAVDFGNTIAKGSPYIFGITHYPSVNKEDTDIGDHSEVWDKLTNEAGVKFIRADARLQEILPIWVKTPNTNWRKNTEKPKPADQPSYVEAEYYYVLGNDGIQRKFSLEGYIEDMAYFKEHGTYSNNMSNPEYWNTRRLLSWVREAKQQGYETMAMTFQIPEWLASGYPLLGAPHTEKAVNSAPKNWEVYRDIIQKVYLLLKAEGVDYYEFLNEPHWYIPKGGDQRDPDGNLYRRNHSGAGFANAVAADQFYQAIDAIYEIEAEIQGVPKDNLVLPMKLGGGADDSWGGNYGVLGRILNDKYENWFERITFISIHKYGENPLNQDNSNSGGNARNVKLWLRQRLGREVDLFLNEYNVSTGQPTDETYGYKSVTWHAKNIIAMMVDQIKGGAYYTAYPADVPMDDYEASSGWVERGKGIYTWNNGQPYLANFTKSWQLMSNTLGLGKGTFDLKMSDITENEGITQAIAGINAEGNPVILLNNHTNNLYGGLQASLDNLPYSNGTKIKAEMYSIDYQTDMATLEPVVKELEVVNGSLTIDLPISQKAHGLIGVMLKGLSIQKMDKTYEFESYLNKFNGMAKIEVGKASNSRYVANTVGIENSVEVYIESSSMTEALFNLYYLNDSGTIYYKINGETFSQAADDSHKFSFRNNLAEGRNTIIVYGDVLLDKLTVWVTDRQALETLISQEYNATDYTEASYQIYSLKKSEAQQILEKEMATQQEIAQAYTELLTAIENLVTKVNLQELVDSIVDSGIYTAKSYSQYGVALKEARQVLSKPDSTEDEEVRAYNKLEEAIKKLQKLPIGDENVILGKVPLTNSLSLLKGEAATNGNTNSTDAIENYLTIEAGPETGGQDNGYSNWPERYLQYDFGRTLEVKQIKIFRTYYQNGGVIQWKDVRVELAKTPEFEEPDIVAPTADFFGGYQTDKAQNIELGTPVEARYIRVYGRGHLGSWGGYSNKMRFSEIQVFAMGGLDKHYAEERVIYAKMLNASDYTAQSFAELSQAISELEEIMNNSALTQAELNEKVLNLDWAIESLEQASI